MSYIEPGPSAAQTDGVVREDEARKAATLRSLPQALGPAKDPFEAWAEDRKAHLAEQAANRKRMGVDPFQTDQGYIPPWRPPPDGKFQMPEEPTMADAFLEAANRLRAANPRQDLPPAETVEELASRHARVMQEDEAVRQMPALRKTPKEYDAARCAGDLLRARLRREANGKETP